MNVVENYDLVTRNSFAVHAVASYFCEVSNLSELKHALEYAQDKSLPVQIIGGGSNILFANDYPGLVVHIGLKGIEWLSESGRVKVAAGENWHEFVTHSIEKGYYGLENLALIPGTVGAAPIQNIGAYGVELASLVESVTVYDRQQDQTIELDSQSCEFAYRDSLFKYSDATHLTVLALTLQLSKTSPVNIAYGALAEQFEKGAKVTNEAVFEAVCKIRRSKLPDPKVLGNAGSFFKNPLISIDKFEKIKQQNPQIPGYEVDEPGLIKTSAAWLLDQAGWKGKRRGGAGVHELHALVLVNVDEASGDEIMLLAQEMASSVLNRFGIALEAEVRII